MAQWSRADRTLYTKLVYYGPAFGGKTTNLESLHRITDPHGSQKLLSVKTASDRTLFFDLLPFDLGDILGYQVAMKLYTVPGQVRYDATRQVVLAGADAIIFVSDSSADREEQNRWSYQNLKMNMRAKRLDPVRVPVLFQFNKQDLADSASPAEVARWLGIQASQGIPAVATENRGVLETFMSASRQMLERLVALADERTRKEINTSELHQHIDRAFAPYIQGRNPGDDAAEPREVPEGNRTNIVVENEDTTQASVQTNIKLAEKLAHETSRSSRLERESESLRRLCESFRKMSASFDSEAIVDLALETAAEILEARVVCLVRKIEGEPPRVERSWGAVDDPLLEFDAGRDLLRRVLEGSGACIIDDLVVECGGMEAMHHLQGYKAAIIMPLQDSQGQAMVAYAPQPDGKFTRQDMKFLATLSGQLSVGLDKARLHEEVARHRDRLEGVVEMRTRQLREAYEELRSLDAMKDRFLANLSHEMKTPLTAILSSAIFLRDYKTKIRERKEMVGSIVSSGEKLQGLLDSLFRLVGLESEAAPIVRAESTMQAIVDESLRLAGQESLPVHVEAGEKTRLQVDTSKLAQAVANLIDNACKFAAEGGPAELDVRPSTLELGEGEIEAVTIAVRDRGPGVSQEDQERIFAPFEQGGEVLTGKPAGFGVGLHEAKTIAEQHGGRLEYRDREGGGSEFLLRVPLKPVPDGSPAETASV